MRLSTPTTILAVVAHAAWAQLSPKLDSQIGNPLYVTTAPSTPRPYIVPAYSSVQAVAIGSQIYRFPVTGPSSGNAFTLVTTAGPASSALGVLPHIHERHYENFYPVKGRVQLWASPNATKDKNATDQSRILLPQDFGAVPINTTHTFQILEPDTLLVGVIAPGGFEDLFFALGQNFSDATGTPYVPAPDSGSSTSGPDPGAISQLQKFDVYAELDYVPRGDLVNGSAPPSDWHSGPNALASNSDTPFFVARNHGPAYLNEQAGFYQVVQPLITPVQAGNFNFTISSITMSAPSDSKMLPADTTVQAASAFLVEEGALVVQVNGFLPALLTTGDTLFVPAGTGFSYSSAAAFTKTLYVSGGGVNSGEGLDTKLIKEGKPWDFPVFPTAY